MDLVLRSFDERRQAEPGSEGAYARAEPYPEEPFEELLIGPGPRLLVAFDRVTDVGNLGSIARSAEVAGATGLVLEYRHAPSIGPGALRTSAGALVGLLLHVAQSDNWDSFVSTLPEAGRRSLRRMYGTSAARNLRAKTGTIDGVSALTGIVTTRDGETLLFSILSNQLRSTGAAKRVEDRIGARLADFRRSVAPTP